MYNKRFFLAVIFSLILALTFWGCSFLPGSSSGGTNENPVGPGTTTGPVTGTITTGQTVQVAQQTVGPSARLPWLIGNK